MMPYTSLSIETICSFSFTITNIPNGLTLSSFILESLDFSGKIRYTQPNLEVSLSLTLPSPGMLKRSNSCSKGSMISYVKKKISISVDGFSSASTSKSRVSKLICSKSDSAKSLVYRPKTSCGTSLKGSIIIRRNF